MSTLECKKLKSGNIQTPRGRLSYVNVLKPGLQVNPDGTSKEQYSTSIAFPKGTNLAILEAAVKEAAISKFGPDYAKKYPRMKSPFHKTADYPKMGLDPEEFPVFIRTSKNPAKGKVGVVDCKTDEVTEESEVYSGRWAMVTVNPWAYGPGNHGNVGVSLGLVNVQLLEHGAPLGGRAVPASDEFEAVELAGGDAADSLFFGASS